LATSGRRPAALVLAGSGTTGLTVVGRRPNQGADLLPPCRTTPATPLTCRSPVTVPGTGDFGRVIAGVAAQLRDVHAERAALAADLDTRLEARPALSLVLAT
ncbi:MAG: family transposase, partial [Actinomycetota bacterium]|nr:family transposase [Actinomycetota bacterium]